ncbi:MAG: ATP-binding protein [Pseudomonadota bacterium]
MSPRKPKKILQNQFFVPFGRFRLGRKRPRDETSVLVGRESERAFLIDALTGIGERGSFLVTGRRGVGKTTFVDSCLKEYEHNVFRRFLGSGAGRRLTDFLLVIGFSIALIVVLLSTSEMLEFLVTAYKQNGILFFPIIACLVIVLLPLMLGIVTLLRAYEASWYWSPRFFASVTAIFFVFVGILSPPFAAPVQTISSLLLALGLLSFFGNAIYFFSRSVFARGWQRSTAWISFIGLNYFLPIVFSVLGVLGVSNIVDRVIVCPSGQSIGSCELLEQLQPGEIRAYVFASLGLGIFIGQYLANALSINREKDRPSGSILKGFGSRPTTRALIIFLLSILAVHGYVAVYGVVAWGVILVSSIAALLPLATTALRYLLEAAIDPDSQKRDSNWLFAPPVEALLIFKAFVLIILSLQLAYPIVGLSRTDEGVTAAYVGQTSRCNATAWAEAVSRGDRPSEYLGCSDLRRDVSIASLGLGGGRSGSIKPSSLPLFERDFLMADYALARDLTNRTLAHASSAPFGWLELFGEKTKLESELIRPTHFTLFRVGTEEAHIWSVLVLILLILIFLMEYDWINRPFVNQRQPRALDRGPRRAFMAHHHLDPIWYERTMAMENTCDPTTKGSDPCDQDFMKTKSARDPVSNATSMEMQFAVKNRLQRKVLNRFRLLESATFPFFVIRLLLPVITVRVNLGFDSLDHRGVSHAMLYGLREAYFRTFVSLSSPYQLVSLFVRIVLVLMLTALVGRSLIDIPPVSDVRLEVGDDIRPSTADDLRDVGSESIAVAIDYDGPWPLVGRYDKMVPQEADMALRDVCTLLDRITWTRVDNLYGTSLVPRLTCLLPARVGSHLIEAVFLPVVQFQTHRSLMPGQTETLGTDLLLYNFVHFNFGLPELHVNEVELEAALSLIEGELDRQENPYVEQPGVFENPLGQQVNPGNFGGTQQQVNLTVATAVAQWPSLTVRVYHLIVAYLLWIALARLSNYGFFLPYRRNYNEISELLDALTLSRSDQKTKSRRFSLPSLFGASGDTTHTEGYETSRGALEPRSVELALLTILNNIRGISDGKSRGTSLTVPKPDLHFVFDELDKLGGLVGSEQTQYGVGEVDKVAVDADRKRTYQLHALFSDMKRIISSAPARFIFVGGRVLHDEWIRDQNRLGSRQPLLTSIFDHEIYLPSLLVDFPRDRFENSLTENKAPMPVRSLDLRIEEFIVSAYAASRSLQENLRPTRLMPVFGLSRMDSTAVRFTDHDMRTGSNAFLSMPVIDGRTELDHTRNEQLSRLSCVRRDEFFSQFKGFMAYRSAGSPKKLRELLGDLIHPSGSYAFPGIKLDNRITESRDVMMVDEKTLYRIQLIDTVFRHIEASFGVDLIQRDDKITINTIFIIDFLMKMHDRAFSWSSIERLDELAHIHRAPDLRRLFDTVVANSAERFFHRVLNGLYVFRFRSELAIEIRYLSRISQAEMAALNFTLDESQELKTTFTNMLNSSGEANPDLLLALGELYEFDQAYDVARGFFERALRMIDEDCARSFGTTVVSDAPETASLSARVGTSPRVSIETNSPAMTAWHTEPMPLLRAVMTDQKAGRELIRTQLPWALRHLRIMLQIGLTYEQSGDEERAQTQYHTTQVFAGYILNTALEIGDIGLEKDEAALSLRQVLKHLSVIFQPVFASAWIAEKLENGVDTSLSIVERELRYLRSRLPFVSDLLAVETRDLGEFHENGRPKDLDAGSNHALVIAELHNKAGDLYFFKGRSTFPVRGREFLEALKTEELRNETYHPSSASQTQARSGGGGSEGYLYRAHYHYAVGLHEVRRYIVYRHNMSKSRLNILGGYGDGWNTHNEVTLPSFVQLTVYSSLVDLAEVTLARSSLLGIWRKLALQSPKEFDKALKMHGIRVGVYNKNTIRNAFQNHRKVFDEWFHKPNQETRKPQGQPETEDDIEVLVRDFFGSWEEGEDRDELIGFVKQNSGLSRILVALFANLSGARFANRANYPDTSSFEHQICAEHCVALLRNALFIQTHRHASELTEALSSRPELKELFEALLGTMNHVKFLAILIDIAIFSIRRQTELIRLAYPSEPTTSRKSGDDKLGSKGRATLVPLVSTLCELRLLVASELVAVVHKGKIDEPWRAFHILRSRLKRLKELTSEVVHEDLLDNVEAFLFERDGEVPSEWPAQEAYRHRREARALLIYLVTHYRYPALTNISGLKALVDDALLVDGVLMRHEKDADLRRNEAFLWIDEILDMEKVLDAPMHFPPTNMAETLTLAAVVRRIDLEERASASGLDEALLRDKTELMKNLENLARKYRWRAEQSFTMGRQYYRNVSRLVYLYDDFNDRRRHAHQARQMCFADLLALYRMILDQRDSDGAAKAGT